MEGMSKTASDEGGGGGGGVGRDRARVRKTEVLSQDQLRSPDGTVADATPACKGGVREEHGRHRDALLEERRGPAGKGGKATGSGWTTSIVFHVPGTGEDFRR